MGICSQPRQTEQSHNTAKPKRPVAPWQSPCQGGICARCGEPAGHAASDLTVNKHGQDANFLQAL